MGNRKALAIVSILAVGFTFASTTGICAKKAPPKKTTANKVNAKNKAKLGTHQLNGDQAEIGVTYTLGKTDPINITLDKVEYTVEPIRYGNNLSLPNAGEKFMVLHYTLHNPNPRPYRLGWSTLEITAVDRNDTNWRYETNVAMESTGETCNMELKPAQKTKVYTSIKVPANGEIPKVIFQSRDRLVLRYDLRGRVTRLPAAIADPSDPTGATALEKVPAELGAYYPLRGLSAKIDSISFSIDPVKGKAPKKGNRYLVILGTAKNNGPCKAGYAWSTIRPQLLDADGIEIRWNGDVYTPSRDEVVHADIEPGNELRIRFVFEVPDNLGLKSLSIGQSTSRAYVYDLSSLK